MEGMLCKIIIQWTSRSEIIITYQAVFPNELYDYETLHLANLLSCTQSALGKFTLKEQVTSTKANRLYISLKLLPHISQREQPCAQIFTAVSAFGDIQRQIYWKHVLCSVHINNAAHCIMHFCKRPNCIGW